MSRGPGRVQQAIEAAFKAMPDATFTVQELGPIAFHGLNRVEKKHRVSILRAAYGALDRTQWDAYGSERPGGQIVFFNTLSVRSYAMARLRTDFVNNGYSVQELQAEFDDPRSRTWELTQTDGSWWLHVELNKAWHSGDSKRIRSLEKKVDKIRSHALRMIGSIDSGLHK